MPRISEVRYSFSVPHRRVLERGRAQEVRLPAALDGQAAPPTGGAYSLHTPDGSPLVDGEAVVIVDGVATYTLSPSEIPATLTLGEGYYEVWSLVMPDGTTRTPRVLVAFARFQLHPALDEDALSRDYPTLNTQRGSAITSWQGYIDSAWEEILRRLTREGAWSYLAVDSSAFYDIHYHLTLAKIFRWLMQKTTGSERSEASYRAHKDEYESMWGTLATSWDHNHDGKPDDATQLQPVAHSVQPAGAPVRSLSGRYGARW